MERPFFYEEPGQIRVHRLGEATGMHPHCPQSNQTVSQGTAAPVESAFQTVARHSTNRMLEHGIVRNTNEADQQIKEEPLMLDGEYGVLSTAFELVKEEPMSHEVASFVHENDGGQPKESTPKAEAISDTIGSDVNVKDEYNAVQDNPHHDKTKAPYPVALFAIRTMETENEPQDSGYLHSILPDRTISPSPPKQTSLTENEPNIEPVNLCHMCGYTDARKDKFSLHMRTHVVEKPHRCSNCQYSCADADELIQHMRIHHTNLTDDNVNKDVEPPLHVDYQQSNGNAHMRSQMRVTSQDVPMETECAVPMVPMSIDGVHSQSDLEKDWRDHTDRISVDLFNCSFCGYHCIGLRLLERHIETYIETHICSVCEFICMEESHLIAHMRSHSGEKTFVCSECGSRVTQVIQNFRNRRMRNHTGNTNFQCSHCEYASALQSDLAIHLKSDAGEKCSKCSVCESTCTQQGHLNRHMGILTGEKQFMCPVCAHTCTRQRYLDTPILTHTGFKRYRCPLCEYRCAAACYLSTHMRSHTGDRPYKCSVCDYRCSRDTPLAARKIVRNVNKKFRCTECDYVCTGLVTLNKHKETHTGGSQLFKCVLCNYSCTRQRALSWHMRTHKVKCSSN